MTSPSSTTTIQATTSACRLDAVDDTYLGTRQLGARRRRRLCRKASLFKRHGTRCRPRVSSKMRSRLPCLSASATDVKAKTVVKKPHTIKLCYSSKTGLVRVFSGDALLRRACLSTDLAPLLAQA
ncbi:hypothetical protein SDRG_06965 [Saprolegnia diclina VS20]|uniref:Uncharacterized protein n=1 Tax=Saprolegnia diclina (strain VS20) TaxID=1156394 RepID=T0QCQ6_SAPDV|nr:hypothetical protein SDRG_06965 [Saprolegnia diclina VS20]EQC35684.1 hypothetical protein SDRG_06965 [Saprolegnia diclina VS20]|eukprot:XP_008611001.1 hypothetical protein SDRG_06965 [Saprolegnia diclina VS20]